MHHKVESMKDKPAQQLVNLDQMQTDYSTVRHSTQ